MRKNKKINKKIMVKVGKWKAVVSVPVVAGVLILFLTSGIGIVGALNGWFGGGGKIPSDTMTRGLVGYWNFDEGSGSTAYDSSGNGKNAVKVGLAGYSYRKQITINHTDDAAQTNYQMMLHVVKGSGTDSASTTYLNNKSLSWPNDIRFTKSDGSTTLDYWIESTDSASSTVWVKFDSIPAHPNNGTFYMYWGKAGASAASDGANTFRFFDDFPGVALNTDIWEGDTSYASVASSVLTYTALVSNKGITSKTHFASPARWRSLQKLITAGSNNNSPAAAFMHASASDYAMIYQGKVGGVTTNQTYMNKGVSGAPINTNWTLDAYTIKEVRWNAATPSVSWFENGTEKTGSPHTTAASIPVSDMPIEVYANSDGVAWSTQYVDWVFVGNYTANEPTWGTWGSEEAYPTSLTWGQGNPSTGSGRGGTAMDFNGTSDYASAGNVYDGVKSVEFWIRADSTTKKILDLNGTQYVEVSNGTTTATSWTSPTIYIDGIATTTLDTNWHHVVITSNTGINASAVDFGRVSTGYFDGKLDEVRFYDRVLSQTEIRYHYNKGAPVAYWKFDEGAGNTAYDSSGNGNNLTLSCGGPVTFTYNGSSVTYGTASSSGKCWMDRNLGATQIATNSTDTLAYGDLFQWGRLDDGHQIRTSASTTVTSSLDVPGHSSFIKALSDWRVPKNNYLWNATSSIILNNPCPSGWRLPTETEWNTEQASWSQQNSTGAYASPLKLTVSGYRDCSDASLHDVGNDGNYWSSTVSTTEVRGLWFNGSGAGIDSTDRAYGSSVRCVMDNSFVPTPPTWTTGKNGTALSFDGINDYVQANVSQSTTTVSFWMQYSGTWRYVTNVNGTYYVNGKKINSAPSPYPIYFSGSTVYIGKTGASSYFNGIIDDVRIYNYARTQDEIKLDYNAGFGARFGPQSSCDDDPGACVTNGLKGYWNFDEGSGSTVYDSSGNGKNAAKVGLAGYSYRKQITINGTADGTQTNYQMMLHVVKGSGTDSASTTYLNNKSLSWPNDIRFTKSDGSTTLDYWVESSDTSSSTVWVEFDSIPISPGTATFYIYYGNASASTGSNGSSTFSFFDDFEDGTKSPWTDGYAPYPSVISSTWSSGGTYSLYGYGICYIAQGGMQTTLPTTNVKVVFDIYLDALTNYGGGGPGVTFAAPAGGTPEWVRQSVGTTLSWESAKITTAAPFTIWIMSSQTASWYIDKVRARNFTTNEPTWGTWGSEEVYPTSLTWGQGNPSTGSGRGGTAMDFNGTSDYASLGSVYNGVKSVEFWIKADNTTKKILDLNGTQYVEVSSGAITATSWTSPTIYIDGVATTTLDTNWHHVVITTNTGINASSTEFGRVSTSYFDGKLDEIRFYDRVLSQTEIRYHHNKGGPVAYWKFDEGTGTTTYDSSGLSNNGIMTVVSSNWLNGYSYRKQININSSADGEQTNYQVPVRVYRTTGTDGTELKGVSTAGKVYVSTNCESDYKDIRFTKSDSSTALDYWIEDSDSASSTIWVELDSVPASGGAVFYMYYGNSGASASSSFGSTMKTGAIYASGGTISESDDNRVHTFSTPGASNFVVLDGTSGNVQVECWGGGGGGGKTNMGGGGGGGGAYAATPDVAVTVTSYAIVVGGGGAPATAGVAGSSTFNTTTVVALGGTGAGTSEAGGAGGVGASGTGTTKYSGGGGAQTSVGGSAGGGGGGAAGPDGGGVGGSRGSVDNGGAGGAGDNGSGGAGGAGGTLSSRPGKNGTSNSLGGGGGGGGCSASVNVGGNGGTPGGGAGGGGLSGGGGTGANGQVVITYPFRNYTANEPAWGTWGSESWQNITCSPDSDTCPSWTTGKNGTALNFNGTNYVQATVSQGITTVSFWMQYNGNWQYVTNVNGTYYINGKKSSTAPSPFPIYFSGNTVYIGKTGASSYFNGIIDDVRIYNYARTRDEIKLDYNAGFGARFGPQSSCDDDPGACVTNGLKGYWNFDEGSGANVYDSSGNGKNGTIAAFSSGLNGYNYRKQIVVQHSDDGAQTNYLFKLLVGESSGATGEDVDCASHCLSSFNDLRFTKSDGLTEMSYYIATTTGTTPNQLATVMIKIPLVAAHPTDTTIYMYYGNTGASAGSNFSNTFGNTGLFMMFDGADAATAYKTETGQTATFAGNAQLDTAYYKQGPSSAMEDGTGDVISIPADDAKFDLADNDFTVECWAYLNEAMGVAARIMVNYGGTVGDWGVNGNAWSLFTYNVDQKLYWQGKNGAGNLTTITSTNAIDVDGGWHHFASVRSGDIITLYLDGTSVGSGTDADIDLPTTSKVRMGADPGDAYNWKGWLDNVMVTNGTAKYTGNFTPVGTTNFPTVGTVGSEEAYIVNIWSSSNSSANKGTALSFNGTNDHVSIGSVYNGVKSVEFWVKADSTTKKILDLNGTQYVEVSNGTTTATGWTSPTIYIDGVATTTLDTNWHHVVIVSNTGINASAVDFGRVSTSYFDGKLDEVRFYDRVLSQTEIRYHYNKGGPIGYWKFDEGQGSTVYDISGNNNTGTMSGATWTEGKNGTALEFDGSNDYINLPSNFDPLPSVTSSETFEFWVKPHSLPSSEYNMSIMGQNYRNAVHLHAAGKIQYGIRYGSNSSLATGPVISLNEWAFYSCIYDGTTIMLYVNGKLYSSAPRTIDSINAASQFRIGHYVIAGNYVYFDGLLDDVRIYNYARTPEQVQQDYNAGFSTHFK